MKTVYPHKQESHADVKKVLTAEDFMDNGEFNKNIDTNPSNYYRWEALDGTVYYIHHKTGDTLSESTYRNLLTIVLPKFDPNKKDHEYFKETEEDKSTEKDTVDHPSTQQSTADTSLKRQAIKLGKKIQFEEKNESLKFKVLTDEDFMNLVKKEKPDMVNHPPHYNVSGFEVIDIIQAFTQDLNGIAAVDTGNAIKYILRWHNKNGIEDLKKARWYIDHLIKKLEEWENDR